MNVHAIFIELGKVWCKYTENHTDATYLSSAVYAWQMYIYIYIYVFAFEIGLALAQIMIYPKKWIDKWGIVIALEFNLS